MKITTFNPLIVTAHPEEIIALFEALGFERRHTKRNLGEDDTTLVRMSLGEFRVDISDKPDAQQDIMMIRMNVDNFKEAHDFLYDKGFKGTFTEEITEDTSSKGTSLISPSGFMIALAEHIKK